MNNIFGQNSLNAIVFKLQVILLMMEVSKKSKIGNFNYLNVAFISYKLTMWDLMLFSGCHTRGQRLRKKDRSC